MGSQNSSPSKNQLLASPQKVEKEINFLNSDLSIKSIDSPDGAKNNDFSTDLPPKSNETSFSLKNHIF